MNAETAAIGLIEQHTLARSLSPELMLVDAELAERARALLREPEEANGRDKHMSALGTHEFTAGTSLGLEPPLSPPVVRGPMASAMPVDGGLSELPTPPPAIRPPESAAPAPAPVPAAPPAPAAAAQAEVPQQPEAAPPPAAPAPAPVQPEPELPSMAPEPEAPVHDYFVGEAPAPEPEPAVELAPVTEPVAAPEPAVEVHSIPLMAPAPAAEPAPAPAPAPAPEPATLEEQVVELPTLAPITPEPKPASAAPEPAAIEPEPAPMAPEPVEHLAGPVAEPELPVVEPAEVPAPVPVAEPEFQLVPDTVPELEELFAPKRATDFRVVVRLKEGDGVEVGSFRDFGTAMEGAQEVIEQFSTATEGQWPFYAGRFIRPDLIVSVDVVEGEDA
jgi:hypothetical protein